MDWTRRIAKMPPSAWVAGAAAVSCAYLLGRYWQRRETAAPRAPAAFARAVAEPGSFEQVREAGPEAMRDGDSLRGWDEVDEGSDASFPASDPPSYALPRSFD